MKNYTLLPIGTRVEKISGKPFKSGDKVNTIAGYVKHPIFPDRECYTFVEDISFVECWRCAKTLT